MDGPDHGVVFRCPIKAFDLGLCADSGAPFPGAGRCVASLAGFAFPAHRASIGTAKEQPARQRDLLIGAPRRRCGPRFDFGGLAPLDAVSDPQCNQARVLSTQIRAAAAISTTGHGGCRLACLNAGQRTAWMTANTSIKGRRTMEFSLKSACHSAMRVASVANSSLKPTGRRPQAPLRLHPSACHRGRCSASVAEPCGKR